MDFKDSKTQKLAIAILAFFIVTYFWYSRAFSLYNNSIETKNQEFETITTNLRNVEMKAKSLDALQLEYADLVGRYHEIEALLPEVKQVPSLLVQMHTASSLTGTKITKVQPLTIESEDFYNVAPFAVEMVGTYHDFGRFISYVANFPFIANVERLQIKAQDAVVANAMIEEDRPVELGRKKETITASFVLSTYFVKEHERLEDLVL
ncbi:MAG TPA: type 4a pilus biogenesis protein PilO [Acidobacteriota bacterium]|nr:type 4a pilus biogenesis protein PilO [Acidobacteriota bacterium]